MHQNRERVKSICNAIAKYLLVVLFVSYYVGGTAFTHTHYFPTYSITHSHPFLPGADGLPHHTHSSAAFNTIQELDDLLMEAASLCLALVTAWVLLSVFIQKHQYTTPVRLVRNVSLRAPPLY